MSDQPPSAREDAILDAALHVFATKGFHAATIRDIARRAGIADGTLYNHFANKEALLPALFERLRRTVIANASPPPADAPPAVALAALLAHPLNALAADDLALFRAVAAELPVNAALQARYRADILAPTLGLPLAATGGDAVDAADADARLRLHIIAALIAGLLFQRSAGDDVLAARWDDLPRVVAALLTGGLAGASAQGGAL